VGAWPRQVVHGVFYADQIMAKHDENYMARAARALDQAKDMEKIKNSANEAGRLCRNNLACRDLSLLWFD